MEKEQEPTGAFLNDFYKVDWFEVDKTYSMEEIQVLIFRKML